MTNEEWLNSKEVWEKSKKSYAHFDWRTNIEQQITYLSNPINIAKHGFYPFIHFKKEMNKYKKTKEGGKLVPKKRDICYAAHIDRCVYQYYAYQLNRLYNEEVARRDLATVVVAYRTNLHESNIEISKRAFDFIRKQKSCYIMIGDFTGFFDNLDHRYLKEQWGNLLGVCKLPPDHYNVFKNITHFSTWELSDLLQLNGLENNRSGYKLLNKKSRVLTPEQYSGFRSHIVKHKEPYGIPQGSPISAVLANLYMIDTDKRVYDAVHTLNGLYMRYSDDFIIILPESSGDTTKENLIQIKNIICETPNLTLEPCKTQYFYYRNGNLRNCGPDVDVNADNIKRVINFLGFTFDGERVCIRAKTISKYYYRMYRKAHSISKTGGYTPTGKKISCKILYDAYSRKGQYKNSGNFFTYVDRALKAYGPQEAIDRDTKRHMIKIRKALNSPK